MKIYLKTFGASLVFLLFSGLNVFGQIPNYVPSNGLVGWWPFNGNANDESGNWNNGTVNGSILVSDRFGNTNSAYFFDNGSDLICTSNSFASPNSLSYSVWIKSVNPGFLLGFNNGQCAHGGQWDRTIIVDDNSQLRYYTFNGTQVFNTASTNVIDDTWKHLVVTMDQNGSKIYVNGIFISSNSSQTVGENTSGWFRFGGLSPNDANNSMIGNYDDVGIWNRALTECEIQDLYNSQLNSFSINGGSDQTLCFGESVTLSATGGTTYTWDNGVQNGVAFVPTGNQTYSVTSTSASGCFATDQVIVTVNPLPIINAGSDIEVCDGSQVTLTATGGDNYSWTNGVINGVAFTEQGTQTYTVTGTDVNNCSNTDQVTVTVNPLPLINAGVDLTVCEGDPVSLTASGGVAYTWDNDVINSLPFTPTHIGDLTYTVTGTSLFGCLNADQVVVTVNEHSVASQTATGLDSYTWLVNGQTYTESGSYAAIIPNEAGCDSTITLDLTLAYTGIEDLEPKTTKKLLKITDLNGKETPFRKNTVLLFIYEDGTVERVYEGE